MEIVYASCLCSVDKYMSVFRNTSKKPAQSVQKYHRLLVEGFEQNKVKVHVISGLPVTKDNCEKTIMRQEDEIAGNITYTYLPIVNILFLKSIIVFLFSFFSVFRKCWKIKKVIVVCDVLNISVSAGALCAAKLLRKKTVGIVTDIPLMLSKGNQSALVRINEFLIRCFDSYLFLTMEMNHRINKFGRPFLVIEGQVDIKMDSRVNNIEDKHENYVCIYSGGLEEQNGIGQLVSAFIEAGVNNAELHLYGNGGYEYQLKEICSKHRNIIYHGVVINEDVVEEQIKATLLINPRPTNREYTKYSFPSKNMEYMVSGTPVLTTKLQGMPEEYYPYVYLIEEESVSGLAEALRSVLSQDRLALHHKGCEAKKFVLSQKNNVLQAKKIIDYYSV